MSKTRVAAYCSVATRQQIDGATIEDQTAYFKELIGRHENTELTGVYFDVGAGILPLAKREAFQKMLLDCKEHKIDAIVAQSMARLSRNTSEMIDALHTLKRLGIPVWFVKEGQSGEDALLLLEILTALINSEG